MLSGKIEQVSGLRGWVWAEKEFHLQLKSESEVAQSCPTLFDPRDCSLPHFSVHGICQARVLEWVAISFATSSLAKPHWKEIVGQALVECESEPCGNLGEEYSTLRQQGVQPYCGGRLAVEAGEGGRGSWDRVLKEENSRRGSRWNWRVKWNIYLLTAHVCHKRCVVITWG